jgi:hypothetical protein
VQYGPRIAAIIVYLHAGQFLSKQRTAQALAELFGIPLSSGTVAGITARAAGRLGSFLDLDSPRQTGVSQAGIRAQTTYGQWPRRSVMHVERSRGETVESPAARLGH